MNSNNTSLVPFGTNPSSNVGKRQFSRLVASMVILTPFVFGVVIGILLSDGYLQFLNSRTAVNAALGITQSLAHFKYLWSPRMGPPIACFRRQWGAPGTKKLLTRHSQGVVNHFLAGSRLPPKLT